MVATPDIVWFLMHWEILRQQHTTSESSPSVAISEYKIILRCKWNQWSVKAPAANEVYTLIVTQCKYFAKTANLFSQ